LKAETVIRGAPLSDEALSWWSIAAGTINVWGHPYEAVKGFPVPGRTLFVTATQRFN
jgi:hypothetical protein